MSKTVIVFSTHRISPLVKNGLFSNVEPKLFTSDILADYFWNRIKKNDEYLKSLLTSGCFPTSERKELIDFLDNNKEELETSIKKIIPTLSISKTDFKWIGDIIATAKHFTLRNELKQKYNAFKSSINNNIDIIKRKRGLELCNDLEKNSKQASYDLDPYNPSVEGPWLYYRFCYYELNNKPDISVYSVWPLHFNSPQQDGKYQWVVALTDQFLSDKLGNNDATELYLILHDNDIEDHTPFKVIIDDTIGKTARYVALFQHENRDEIGEFLLNTSNDCSPEHIKSYVEEQIMVARIRKWLCDAYDHIINNDVDKLWGAAAELIKLDNDKFKCIYEIADKIEGGTPTATKQHLDQLKLELLKILNEKLRKHMIIGKS